MHSCGLKRKQVKPKKEQHIIMYAQGNVPEVGKRRKSDGPKTLPNPESWSFEADTLTLSPLKIFENLSPQ